MESGFRNVYEDRARAAAYDQLEFPGTYFLAFRDLPAIVARHAHGGRALDFGCGAGRSTRFLGGLGFEVTGVDVSEEMLAHARRRDPAGDYRRVPDGDLTSLGEGTFDLALAAFPFDNVPTMERKVALLAAVARTLRPGAVLVNLASAPEIYVNEWASFTTRDYPGNRAARSGDTVRIVMLDVGDRRPVEDVLWTDEAWAETYRRAGLEVLESNRPLGRAGEPHPWVSETTVAPWVVSVLRPLA